MMKSTKKNIMMATTKNKQAPHHDDGSACAGRPRVSAIGPCDVLLGRGTGPNENQGNKMFRDILRKYKEAYGTVETKREKREIVTTAIEEFKAVGGRFLVRIVVPSSQQETTRSSGKYCYDVVDGPAVSLKARQAFRYLLRGEIDDDHKERNTPSRPKSMVEQADLPSQETHRLPTIHCSTVEPTSTCEASSISMHTIIVPSQVENGNKEGDLTSREDVKDDIHDRLAALVSEAPMLASLRNASHYCPTTSPWWVRQGLIPLSSLVRLRKIMSDTAGSTSPSNPEMLLNAMRFPESWWAPARATDHHANTHGIPGFLTNHEIMGHCGHQYPTMSDISQIATRAKLLADSALLQDLLSPTGTDSLISSQYRRNLSEPSQQAVVESSHHHIILEQRRAVASALIEHHLHENRRLTALAIPDLQRIMMMHGQQGSCFSW